MKFAIIGSSGVLGTELVKYLNTKPEHTVIPLKRTDFDIVSAKTTPILENIDYVIHTAGFVDTFGCENHPDKAMDVNVKGTINVVNFTNNLNAKLIYISSEYVFSGETGNYTIHDRLNPINVYGKTKAASEYIVSICKKYQIIRCPFFRKIHDAAFTDQICNRYFVTELPEKIINNILYNSENIVHITGEIDTVYNLYKKHGLDPVPIQLNSELLPKNTSLKNTSKY